MSTYQVNPTTEKTAPQPTSCPARYANVPRELIERSQWVAWVSVPNPKRKKPEKVPINPRTGRKASTTDASTWGTHAQAVARCRRDNLSGVGFVLTTLDPFTGIDLDSCRNPATGEITPWAENVIQYLDSYAETSPSGTGIRIFLIGKLPAVGRKKGAIEVYEAERFLTLTGNHLEGTPHTIENRQAELTTWHASVWGLWSAKPSKSIDGEGVRGVNTLIPPLGVLTCNPQPIPLKSRFQIVSWGDGLAQAMLVRD
jgi:putative DNA primase/helicase